MGKRQTGLSATLTQREVSTVGDMMTKKAAGAAVVEAKTRLGITWATLADTIDAPLAWSTSALLGQHPMSRKQAELAAGGAGSRMTIVFVSPQAASAKDAMSTTKMP